MELSALAVATETETASTACLVRGSLGFSRKKRLDWLYASSEMEGALRMDWMERTAPQPGAQQHLTP